MSANGAPRSSFFGGWNCAPPRTALLSVGDYTSKWIPEPWNVIGTDSGGAERKGYQLLAVGVVWPLRHSSVDEFRQAQQGGGGRRSTILLVFCVRDIPAFVAGFNGQLPG